MNKKLLSISAAALIALSLSACGSSTPATSTPSQDATAAQSDTTTAPAASTPAETTPAADSSATLGEKNALKSAQNYISMSGFSHDGLVQQLEFDGYSTEEATFAADNCGADWNQMALGVRPKLYRYVWLLA